MTFTPDDRQNDSPEQVATPTCTPLVRVIIVNYNSGAYLRRCLAALMQQTMARFEVAVVDNASQDASLDVGLDDQRISFLRLERNIGFAPANNLAAEGATTPFLALLNPDAIPRPDWLSRLLAAAQERSDVQLFGSLQLQDHDPSRIDGAGDVYFCAGTAWRTGYGRPADTDLASARRHAPAFGACAAAALIRTAWFERLGGFDGDYFCYFEDVDLAFRLRLLGGEVLQVNDAVVLHGGSITAGMGSDFVLYHTTRNQLWTFLKAMPLPLVLPLLPVHALLIGMKWLKAAREGRGAVVSRAVRDAMRGGRAVLAKRRAIQRSRAASTKAIAAAMTWSPAAFRARRGPD